MHISIGLIVLVGLAFRVTLAGKCSNLPQLEVLSGSSNNHIATLVLPVRNKDDGKLYFADFGTVDLDGSTCYMSRLDGTKVVDVKKNLGKVASWTCTFPADQVTGPPAGRYKPATFSSAICDIRVGPHADIAYFGRSSQFKYTHGVTKSVTVTCDNLPMTCPPGDLSVSCLDVNLWWTSAFRNIKKGVLVGSSKGRLQKGEGVAAVPLKLDGRCDAVHTVTQRNINHNCRWLPKTPVPDPTPTVSTFTSRYQTCSTAQRYVASSVRYVVQPKSVTVDSSNVVTVDCQFDPCER